MSWWGFGVFAGEFLTQNSFLIALHSHAPPQPPYAPWMPRRPHSLLILDLLTPTIYPPSSLSFNKLPSCRSSTFMMLENGN